MTDKTKTPTHDDLPYRPCAGVVVFNKLGQVFIGHRKDMPTSDATAWQLPQGGIDRSEDPQQAALRELYEETSIRTVSILAEAPGWISYDLPEALLGVALKGKYRGQTQKWYAVLFEADEAEINVLAPGDGTEKAEFDAWRWADLTELPELAIPFKRDAYEAIVTAFRDVATRLKSQTQHTIS